MNPKQRLIKFLDEEILPAEKTESRETLAAYIVGELICDYDDIYEELKNEWFLVLGLCRNYVNLVVDTKYEGQDILENKLYNELFDPCIFA